MKQVSSRVTNLTKQSKDLQAKITLLEKQLSYIKEVDKYIEAQRNLSILYNKRNVNANRRRTMQKPVMSEIKVPVLHH